jgi:hypothetical protein
MTVMDNFSFFFSWLMWKFLKIFRQCGAPNIGIYIYIYIIDEKQKLTRPYRPVGSVSTYPLLLSSSTITGRGLPHHCGPDIYIDIRESLLRRKETVWTSNLLLWIEEASPRKPVLESWVGEETRKRSQQVREGEAALEESNAMDAQEANLKAWCAAPEQNGRRALISCLNKRGTDRGPASYMWQARTRLALARGQIWWWNRMSRGLCKVEFYSSYPVTAIMSLFFIAICNKATRFVDTQRRWKINEGINHRWLLLVKRICAYLVMKSTSPLLPGDVGLSVEELA